MSNVLPPQITPKQQEYRKRLIRRLKKRGMFIKDAKHTGAGTYGLLSPHGKMYIGKSVRYKGRMKDHKSDAYSKKNGNWKENRYLYNALRKWGWDRFEKFIFEKHDETRADIDEVLNKQEIALIAEFETFTDRSKGYNLTAGGEGTSGRKMTPEQLATQTARVKKRWEDPEFKAKTIVALKESSNRPEAKAASSKRFKKLWEDAEWRKKTIAALTEAHNRPEVKAKISAGTKKSWASAKGEARRKAQSKRQSKPVVSKQLLSNKNSIKTYQLIYHTGQTAAAEDIHLLFGIKIDNSAIGKIIKSKKRTRSGFEFENYKGAPGQPTPERPVKKMRVAFI